MRESQKQLEHVPRQNTADSLKIERQLSDSTKILPHTNIEFPQQNQEHSLLVTTSQKSDKNASKSEQGSLTLSMPCQHECFTDKLDT